MSETLPFGSWPSPISAAGASASSLRLDGARFAGAEGSRSAWWAESLPSEGGRIAVRRRGDDGIDDVLPAPWNARSHVHEYGGGAWTVADETLFFVEHTDQRIRRLAPGLDPEPLTPSDPNVSYGGLEWGVGRLVAVRERSDDAGGTREVVEIPLDGSGATDDSRITVLVAGSDFVAQPRLSPGGDRLAWIAWNHPDMPWDAAELRVGLLEHGRVTEWTTVAGGAVTSAVQPEWTGADELTFADDPSGRWNLFRVALDGITPAGVTQLAPADADTGGPLWVLGTRWYRPLADGRIVAVRTDGADELVVIDPRRGTERVLAGPPTSRVEVQDASGTRVLVTGSGARSAAAVWDVDVDEDWPERPLRTADGGIGIEWLPEPRAFTTRGPDGDVHAFDYPPTNPDVRSPDDESPPYVVKVHGGPTSHVGGEASAQIAYFTSRGIGVLEVNYGGSSGYGRAYRDRLRGQFGVVDVNDVAAAAAGLAEAGLADPDRLVIEGGSSGGWTVYSALTDTDVFAAGISRYGVADLRMLAADTHEFEARYLDGLVGPLPEAEAVYIERSPLSHPERFRVPVLLFQGADDRVVPPSQSEAIRDALVAGGVTHAYRVYEGEGHGFRRTETLVDVLESELSFLGQVLGFDTPGVVELPLTGPLDHARD